MCHGVSMDVRRQLLGVSSSLNVVPQYKIQTVRLVGKFIFYLLSHLDGLTLKFLTPQDHHRSKIDIWCNMNIEKAEMWPYVAEGRGHRVMESGQ